MARKKLTVKPRRILADALRRGHASHRLGTAHKDVIEPRLAAGRLDGLAADLVTLEGAPADRGAAHTKGKAATGAERDTAGAGLRWIMDIREMAKRTAGIKEGELKAFGVGQNISAASTNKVIAAIRAILDTVAKNPDLARRIGMLDADAAAGDDLAKSLEGADAAQKEVRAANQDKTFDKDVVQLRVEAAIDEISSRGKMAFACDPALRARFEALVSSAGPAKEDTEEASATPAAEAAK